MNSYQTKNEDDYMLYLGRISTGMGIAGIFLGILISLFAGFSRPALFFFSLFAGYIGLSGFWGIHRVHKSLRKYRWQLPDLVYKFFKLLAIPPGIILGMLFYGAFQQFVLLLALDDGSGKPGLFQSVLILTPYLGPWYAEKINYNPYGRKHQNPPHKK